MITILTKIKWNWTKLKRKKRGSGKYVLLLHHYQLAQNNAQQFNTGINQQFYQRFTEDTVYSDVDKTVKEFDGNKGKLPEFFKALKWLHCKALRGGPETSTAYNTYTSTVLDYLPMKLVGPAYEFFQSENISSLPQLFESFGAFFGEQKASPIIL